MRRFLTATAALSAAMALAVSTAPVSASAQAAAGARATASSSSDLKILNVGDYGRWKRVTSAELSPDGAWMTYVYAPNTGEGRVIHAMAGDLWIDGRMKRLARL